MVENNPLCHNTEKSSKKRGSVYRRLIFWFVISALLPLAIFSWFSYLQATNSLKNAANEELLQSATLNRKFITTWFDYRFMDVSIQAESYSNVELLQMLSKTGSKECAISKLYRTDYLG